MIRAQERKQTSLIKGVSSATTATTTGTVDTLGYDYAQVHLVGDTGATALTVVSLKEGDTTSAYTAITAFTGGTATSTSAGFVIPDADTSTSPEVLMNVDLRGRKRYLQLAVTTGVAGIIEANVGLMRGSTPSSQTIDEGVVVTG
jgi:hypothetical protein